MDYTSFRPGNKKNFIPPQLSQLSRKNFTPKFFVLIVLILILGGVAYGGILYWQKWQVAQRIVPTFTPRPDVTADWQTYRNEQYGFEFKYPDSFYLSPTHSAGPIETIIGDDTVIYVFIYSKFTQIDSSSELTIDGKRANKGDYFFEIELSPDEVLSFQFDKEDTAAPGFLNKILATFKFIEPDSVADTSTWETYTNEQYGFEFKYPEKYFSHPSNSDSVLLLKSDKNAQTWDIRISWYIWNSGVKSVNELTNLKNSTLFKTSSEDVLKLSTDEESKQVGYIFVHNGKEYDFEVNTVSLKIMDDVAQILSTFKFTK